ncbi:MAG: 2-oxoglutarate dehydrogenase E1 component [Gemmatimonadota bacterium]
MTDPREDPLLSAADGYNAGYAEQMAERALRERGLIPPSLVDMLEHGAAARRGISIDGGTLAGTAALEDRLRLAAVAGALVEAYRAQGHLDVQLDPLGSSPPGHPSLKPEFHGISEEELGSLPAAAVGLERHGSSALDAIRVLQGIYCGPIGYELDHMENPAQWDWLVDYIESGRHRGSLDPERAKRLLARLSEVEGMEHFLHRSYLGQKRFSIEGLDMMIPMLDEAIRRAVSGGTQKVLIGMAHRGRLNVLAHIIGRSYKAIMAEFEGQIAQGLQTTLPETASGDVKYHIGARERVATSVGEVEISLAPNPSHLEHVNPVLEGMARATREQIAGRVAGHQAEDGAVVDVAHGTAVLPILIHGDSAFAGQGVVAETLNLCRLPGYETGGTLHLVANNQLGFTTDPEDSRSTRYASDLALAFRIPILHVNADDPEACVAAMQLGMDYRTEFGEDIVIDLVGYRRYGHNEADEPGYTQPLMYKKIHSHSSVREQWAETLAARGVVSEAEARGMADDVADLLTKARVSVQEGGSSGAGSAAPAGPTDGDAEPSGERRLRRREPSTLTEEGSDDRVDTGVPLERLQRLNDRIHAWPEGFNLFQKLDRQLTSRKDQLEANIDWAHGETLAFASLLTQGVPIRLSGEDVERATFSQRHLVLHDTETGERLTPLQHLSSDQAPFQVWNSPLSEVAVLGFEYGYSTVATETLVLWEAQFGDFANVAQAITDQFIVAGRSKWGQESRLVLLLPHGHEGQGPEHSSARLERFLDLAAEDNIRVVNCTTPAQYFHLLRLQALRKAHRPLVVMTPKSLLRHPAARSRAAELAGGEFQRVFREPDPPPAADVRRLLICSGKIFYDLINPGSRADGTAITRLEQLYPFPENDLLEELATYPNLAEILWVQEEPANMGAWRSIAHRLKAVAAVPVRYIGRPDRASPAEGYAAAHSRQQERIVSEALGI